MLIILEYDKIIDEKLVNDGEVKSMIKEISGSMQVREYNLVNKIAKVNIMTILEEYLIGI